MNEKLLSFSLEWMCELLVICLRHPSGNCLEGLKNTTQSSIRILHLRCNLNHGAHETEAGMLAAE